MSISRCDATLTSEPFSSGTFRLIRTPSSRTPPGAARSAKRLVVRNGHGEWEVRIPGAHKPVSQHRSLDDAKREAREFVAKAGGGEVMILV
ncbi:MAG: DUF2188 domain-containing protein [Acidimicrobiia bacterium]|nr:DUF2188 domain-containing protein [Acidimicrobiia bacterium]MYC45261.1 DUF2188 domain-containing protein [Acidimicrobiia bacterium]MYI20046.1 DUF2188 domain-containing protein [Acidimicrobiia bacterium]